jgi:hypothetical protein
MKVHDSPILMWLLAFLVTLSLAYFQRATGPTHPARIVRDLSGVRYAIRLPRTHGGTGGLRITIPSPAAGTTGIIAWRHFPSSEPWMQIPLVEKDGKLTATIPHQPPAGKVEYHLVLYPPNAQAVVLPSTKTLVARFKGAVPLSVLLPHILCMFLSMLLATRAVLGAVFWPARGVRVPVILTGAFLVAGGLILGPIVQFHAFGAYWTGWPYGYDLTDNKTLLAFLAWLPALIIALRRRPRAGWIVAGWIVMMGVFLVPHSMHGSQIDWSKVPRKKLTSRQPVAVPRYSVESSLVVRGRLA